MALTLDTPHGQLVFTPEESDDGSVVWHCAAGAGVRAAQLPSYDDWRRTQPRAPGFFARLLRRAQ